MFVCSECGTPQAAAGNCPADGTPLAPVGEDVLLGTTIGVYRVARLLGIGGMGRVYKGVHPQIGSRVAIKVLSRECSDRRDLVERFFAEAKAVNLIRHESIVNVLDLAMLPDGRPYIIMEYLDGAPLASIIEHGITTQQALPLGGLARLCAEVLDALGAAHQKGIVHRDLKPDNIFVAPSGRPKVLDFGIAKLTDHGSMLGGSATRTGSLLGTPHYMSPEQAAGKPVDHRADIYAMGVILFECATGAKPFLADSLFDLLRKHVEAPPPSPRALRADLSPELESVILMALAKAPDQRFSTAQAMSMALQHATTGLPPEAWMPITGSGVHRPSSGWQHTPPASWGGGTNRSPAPPQHISHQTTVSASSGQVKQQPPAKPPSKKGLWIALAAIALVGGGITAAVLASGGSSSGSEPVAATTPPPAPPPPPAAGTGSVAAAAGSDEADIDDEIIKQLPAEVQQELAALDGVSPEMKQIAKELSELSKLPPAERVKKLQEIEGKLAKAAGGAVAANVPSRAAGGGKQAPKTPAVDQPAEAPPPATPAPAAPPSKTDDPDTPSRATGTWIDGHALPLPSGWDPKRVDVSAFVAFAMAQAKKAIPDAQLIRIDADGVSPDGRANLTLPTLASDHGSVDVRFISRSHAVRDPKLPVGVPVEWKCEFRVEAEPDGVSIWPINGWDCNKETPLPVPRCSAAGVWKIAASAKKLPANAVASLGYRAWQGKSHWYFDIGSGMDKIVSEVFNDGC
jgi:eukaryotic-like serine/threonine-protein kinase